MHFFAFLSLSFSQNIYILFHVRLQNGWRHFVALPMWGTGTVMVYNGTSGSRARKTFDNSEWSQVFWARATVLPHTWSDRAQKPLIGWVIWRKTRHDIDNAPAQKLSFVQIFQDGGRPQVESERIQVAMDRVMMRSVIRSVIDSNGFQRNRFGGHALEQIAFEVCSPPVELELRVFGSWTYNPWPGHLQTLLASKSDDTTNPSWIGLRISRHIIADSLWIFERRDAKDSGNWTANFLIFVCFEIADFFVISFRVSPNIWQLRRLTYHFTTTFRLFIFKQCLKKTIGTTKKSFLIFSLKITELSVPKILTLKFMYDLNKREKPSPPKSSRQEQLSVQSTE